MVSEREDIDTLKNGLRGRAIEFCETLWPLGGLSGREWRCGDVYGNPSKKGRGGGSFACSLHPDRLLVGVDAASGYAGGPFDHICEALGLTMDSREPSGNAIVWARRWLGREADVTQSRTPRIVVDPAKAAAEIERRRDLAQAMWHECQPIEGTAAEIYLRGTGPGQRAIGAHVPLPPTLAFHPHLRYVDEGKAPAHYPALVAVVESYDARFLGIQRIFLRPDGSGKAPVGSPKMTLGAVAGGGVWISRPQKSGYLAITEGLDNALSFWEVARMKPGSVGVVAALSTSGIRALWLPPEVRVPIVHADLDVEHVSQSTGLVYRPGTVAAEAAVAKWRAQGREQARFFLSPKVPGHPTSDLNLVLRHRKGLLARPETPETRAA